MQKRFIACVLALLCVCALLASCGSESATEDSSLQESSGQDQSAGTESSDISEENSDNSYQDNSEETSQDNSEDNSAPEQSEPDISLPESTNDEAPGFNGSFAAALSLNAVERQGKSFRIAYTKENPTAAKVCVTNPAVAITAIFDGSTTRFFDALSGEYYTILVGDYTVLGSNDSFVSANGKKGIRFTRDQGSMPVWENIDDEFSATQPIIYWSQTYKTAYTVMADKDGKLDIYCFTESSFVPCISNGKYGIVNNGTVLVPFEYDYIQSYQGCAEYASNSNLGVYLAKKDGKTYYITANGTNLTPEGFTCGSVPYGNRAWVFENDHGFVLEFN